MTPEAQGAVERAAEVSLTVRAFVIDPHPDADRDTEMAVRSVEIEDGVLWVYLRATPHAASHDETAALTEAVEAEWFNGNVAEDVRDRLLAATATPHAASHDETAVYKGPICTCPVGHDAQTREGALLTEHCPTHGLAARAAAGDADEAAQ